MKLLSMCAYESCNWFNYELMKLVSMCAYESCIYVQYYVIWLTHEMKPNLLLPLDVDPWWKRLLYTYATIWLVVTLVWDETGIYMKWWNILYGVHFIYVQDYVIWLTHYMKHNLIVATCCRPMMKMIVIHLCHLWWTDETNIIMK